ncbi:MAG TPA: universal stress protein, partial [Anaeromyxobacteraceae bacterium]|nr:universal stress protein [Anaeromyxobacteraceae bacterium]
VYVETPREAPNLIDAEAQRFLLANVEKARELGAEVVRLKSRDAAAALLDFARSHGVSDVIIGRTEVPWWRRLLRASVLERLVRDGAGLDLHIVSFFEEEPRA